MIPTNGRSGSGGRPVPTSQVPSASTERESGTNGTPNVGDSDDVNGAAGTGECEGTGSERTEQ